MMAKIYTAPWINDVLKTLSDPKFDVESTADTPVGLKAVLQRV